MNQIVIRKKVRAIAARLGILRPLRALVFKLRGSNQNFELDFLKRFIDSDTFVFDVGANRGQSSEKYIMLGARVVAFEPQEDLHPEINQLCRNSSKLTIVSCGLGHKEEVKRFYITNYDQAASFREDWEGERIGEKSIQVSTLDRQIQIYGTPTYCKIDVEGWELEVLKGLSKPIQVISFEYHNSMSEINRAKEVLKRIEELGTYFCNIKFPSNKDFFLANFIPVDEFAEQFPDHLNPVPTLSYGDIYCFIDTSIIR